MINKQLDLAVAARSPGCGRGRSSSLSAARATASASIGPTCRTPCSTTFRHRQLRRTRKNSSPQPSICGSSPGVNLAGSPRATTTARYRAPDAHPIISSLSTGDRALLEHPVCLVDSNSRHRLLMYVHYDHDHLASPSIAVGGDRRADRPQSRLKSTLLSGHALRSLSAAPGSSLDTSRMSIARGSVCEAIVRISRKLARSSFVFTPRTSRLPILSLASRVSSTRRAAMYRQRPSKCHFANDKVARLVGHETLRLVDLESANVRLADAAFNEIHVTVEEVSLRLAYPQPSTAVEKSAPITALVELALKAERADRVRVDSSSVVDAEIPIAPLVLPSPRTLPTKADPSQLHQPQPPSATCSPNSVRRDI